MKVLFLSTKTGEGEGIEKEFSIPFWVDIFKLSLTFKHFCVCVWVCRLDLDLDLDCPDTPFSTGFGFILTIQIFGIDLF